MLYSHADHVEEYQHEDRDLKPPRYRNIIEQSVIWILGTLYNFLRLLPSELLHSCIVMLLALCEEHFQNSSFILQYNEI